MYLVLSEEEYAFLCALDRKKTARDDALLSLPEALARAGHLSGGGRIVVALTPEEARGLDRLARDSYAFITESERWARLVLRGKIRRVLGPDEPSAT